jgi:hypothetical protein
MRFSTAPVALVLVAFAAGYGVSRNWSSARAVGARNIKPAVRSAPLIARTEAFDGSAAERLIALCKQPGSLARDQKIFEALQSMNGSDFFEGVADFPSFVKRLEQLPPGMRDIVAEAAMQRWLEVDADGAKRWLRSAQIFTMLGQSREGWAPSFMMTLFSLLGRNDPAWAYSTYNEMKPGTRLYASQVLFEIAKADPREARAIYDALRTDTGKSEKSAVESEEKSVAIHRLLSGLVESDLPAAIEIIRGMPQGSWMQNATISSCLVMAGKVSTTAAHDLLALVEDPKDRSAMMWDALGGIGLWSTSDPILFVEQELASIPQSDRSALVGERGVIGGLASKDPYRAADLISGFDGKVRDQAVQELLQTWTKSDPAAAFQWLSTQTTDILQGTTTRWDQTLAKLANTAPTEFGNWANSLSAGELQDRSRVLLATRFAEQGDVTQALRVFQQSFTTSMSGNTAQTFGRTIASQDPVAAATFVAELPPGRTQAKAAEGVVAIWGDRDPRATASWVARFPEGDTRDFASAAFAGSLAHADPVAASEWVAQIRNTGARTRAALDVFRTWAAEDPVLARKWIRGLDNINADRVNAALRY